MCVTLIKAKYCLVGENFDVIENAHIYVTEGKIERIAGEVASDINEDESIDLGERYVFPGLFETHGHIALDARRPNHLEMMTLSECEQTIMSLKNLSDDLMSGITTERCLGDKYYIDIIMKEKIARGEVIGPDLLVSGKGMKSIHGHGYVGYSNSGIHEYRAMARENLKKGVDVLKIFVSPGMPVAKKEEFIPCYMTKDEIAAVVEEARLMNVKVAAHCTGGKGLDYCVEAGVDTIEHIYSITEEQVSRLENEFKGWINFTSGIVLDPEREPFCSKKAVEGFRRAREYSRQCMEPVYRSEKIRYAIGTDANHGKLYREFDFALQAGATNRRVFSAVTTEAAKMCGVENTKGQLTVGYAADIIASRENPLENLDTLRKIDFVMKGGKVFKHV